MKRTWPIVTAPVSSRVTPQSAQSSAGSAHDGSPPPSRTGCFGLRARPRKAVGGVAVRGFPGGEVLPRRAPDRPGEVVEPLADGMMGVQFRADHRGYAPRRPPDLGRKPDRAVFRRRQVVSPQARRPPRPARAAGHRGRRIRDGDRREPGCAWDGTAFGETGSPPSRGQAWDAGTGLPVPEPRREGFDDLRRGEPGVCLLHVPFSGSGGPAGTRTRNLRLKRPSLCH